MALLAQVSTQRLIVDNISANTLRLSTITVSSILADYFIGDGSLLTNVGGGIDAGQLVSTVAGLELYTDVAISSFSTALGFVGGGGITTENLTSSVAGLEFYTDVSISSFSTALGSVGGGGITTIPLSLSTAALYTSSLLASTISVSSITVDSLIFGDGNGWAYFGAIQAVALSTLQTNTGTLYASSVQANYFIGDGSLLSNLPGITTDQLVSSVTGLELYTDTSISSFSTALGFIGGGGITTENLTSTVAGLELYTDTSISSFSTALGFIGGGGITTENLTSSVTGLELYTDTSISSFSTALGFIGGGGIATIPLFLSTAALYTSSLLASTISVSSITVDNLIFGDGNGWAYFGAIQAVALSSIQTNTGTLYASSVQANYFIGDGSLLTNVGGGINSGELVSTVIGVELYTDVAISSFSTALGFLGSGGGSGGGPYLSSFTVSTGSLTTSSLTTSSLIVGATSHFYEDIVMQSSITIKGQTVDVPGVGAAPLYLVTGNGSIGANSTIVYSTDINTWTQVQSGGFENVVLSNGAGNEVSFINGAFYIGGFIGNGGSSTSNLQYSSNASNFTSSNLTNVFTTSARRVAANGAGLYVATGSGTVSDAADNLKYSTDGLAWTNVSRGGFVSGSFGVAYGGGIWVAVGNNLDAINIQYSGDGSNWSNATSGGFSDFGFSVSYNPGTGYWVAVGQGSGGTIVYSSNATDWITASSGLFINDGFDVTNDGSNTWIAVGDSTTYGTTGTIRYSTDNGSNWSQSALGGFVNAGRGIAYNGSNLWVAVGEDNSTPYNSIQTSTDGSNWTPAGTATFTSVGSGIAYGGGYWVATGSVATASEATTFYSSDGNVWYPIQSGGFTASNATYIGYGVAFNGSNQWVAVGQATHPRSTIQTSSDGSNFTAVTSGGFTFGGFGVTYGAGLWVAAGITAAPESNLQYSTDGINWQGANTGGFDIGGSAVLYNGSDLWIAVGESGTSSNIQYSIDGSNWNNSLSGSFSNYGTCVAYDSVNGVYVAGGSNPDVPYGNLLYSTDGSNWSASTSNAFVGGVNGVAYNGSDLWVAVGEGGYAEGNLQYSFDGLTWNPSITGGFDDVYGRSVTFDTLTQTWIAVGVAYVNESNILYSTDGSNWTGATTPAFNSLFFDFGAYGVAAGTTNNGAITVSQAITYTLSNVEKLYVSSIYNYGTISTHSLIVYGTSTMSVTGPAYFQNLVSAQTVLANSLGLFDTVTGAPNYLTVDDGTLTVNAKTTILSQTILNSTIAGLGTLGYISTPGGMAGVAQIIAGSNITISPPEGTGVVTINATGGGGDVTSASLVSTVVGLGSSDYVSSLSLVSTTAGITFDYGSALSSFSTNFRTSPNYIAQTLYLNQSLDVAPYKELGATTVEAPLESTVTTLAGNTDSNLLCAFQTDFNLPTFIPSGIWDLNLFTQAATNNAVSAFYNIYTRAPDTSEILLFDSENVPIADGIVQQYSMSIAVPYIDLIPGSTIVLKVYGSNYTASPVDISCYFQNYYYSHMHTTFNSAINNAYISSVFIQTSSIQTTYVQFNDTAVAGNQVNMYVSSAFLYVGNNVITTGRQLIIQTIAF